MTYEALRLSDRNFCVAFLLELLLLLTKLDEQYSMLVAMTLVGGKISKKCCLFVRINVIEEFLFLVFFWPFLNNVRLIERNFGFVAGPGRLYFFCHWKEI